jgi:hypothetical protein
VVFAAEADGVGFATESYAASAPYTTLASLSGALSRIRRANTQFVVVASHLVVPCVVGVARGGASCCNASCNAKRSRHARVLHAPEQNRELERCSV